MAYHHLALAARDMRAIHHFYEGVMGFELVKVEIGPVPEGGWGKHFFYRMDGDNARFIAFWELRDTPTQDAHQFDLNAATNLPKGTNHLSFAADSVEDLHRWRRKWNEAGLDVLEIDHNWCHSVYTFDPNGNLVEFCCTTADFSAADRQRALDALGEKEFRPTPAPSLHKHWPATPGGSAGN
ncbi:MAG: VOC family protein [Halieaceae bacterium]|jgi:catechol 2,3-dioxygenase-like lactoylglutathione lyase family enzyme|nr:VOC family protein [Halieaceae bacterium]